MKPLKPDNNVNSNQPNKITCTNNSHSPSPSNSVKISAYAWKMLAILSCIATMVMYAETMLIPGIPDLIRDFHVSYSMSSWILTSYLIAGAVMTPIAGKLSDIYGRKKILLVIMVIYAIGVSVAAFASDVYFMIFARAIQGIGMSMFPIAFGAVVGLTVGGIIVQDYGWQSTFFTIIPIAISLLIIIWRFIHITESNGADQKQRIPGRKSRNNVSNRKTNGGDN